MCRYRFLLRFSSLWGLSVLLQASQASATLRQPSNVEYSCATSSRVVTLEWNEDTLEYEERLSDSSREQSNERNQSLSPNIWQGRECSCARHQWESKHYCPIESTTCAAVTGGVVCLATGEASQLLRNVRHFWSSLTQPHSFDYPHPCWIACKQLWPVVLIVVPIMVTILLFTHKKSLAIRYIRSWNSPSNDEQQVEQLIQHPELLHQRPWRELLQQHQLRIVRIPRGSGDSRTREASQLRLENRLVLKTTTYHAGDGQQEDLDDTSVMTMSEDGRHGEHQHADGGTSSDQQPSDDDDDIFSNNKPCCAICIAELKEGDKIADIACPHLFHVECIKPWCERKNTCPLCGGRVATNRKRIATTDTSIASTSPRSRSSSANQVDGDLESGASTTTTT